MFWYNDAYAQSFPYHLSVEAISGQCYDDARLVFTLTDDNGNAVQIDPQTHNAVNTALYPLYNVQYHYQNVSSGLGVQYDYNNNVMLTAGTYHVGVRANIASPSGVLADTTLYNVVLTTSYQPMQASALTNLAIDNIEGQERFGYHPSFHCADLGRIQLWITQGSFPYEVTILDEQQDTVRHAIFHHRVNSGTFNLNANYRDYYTFDSLPIGNYSIFVSDSCGYAAQPMSFSIPDAEPANYYALVRSSLNSMGCIDETVVPFSIQRIGTSGFGTQWNSYTYPYLDSVLQCRFINPGHDTTEWRNVSTPQSSVSWFYVYDTLPGSYCEIFNDSITVQLYDLCHDTLMTFFFRFLPEFTLFDSTIAAHIGDSIVMDTCANHLQSGVSTQSHLIAGKPWSGGSTDRYGGSYYFAQIPFRYYSCPLTYEVRSLPDSTLLAHRVSDDFALLGDWVTFGVDTSVSVCISVTDSLGCQLTKKDTVFVYQTAPLDDLLFWFECHSDKDDDGQDHCCDDRYLWIQEHGVAADTFRRNMTLRLMDSPLYDKFNFTAVRQDGVWDITFDNPDNHSTYIDFSYEDGWRATLRDSVCLPPGRYVFEVTTDCGVDTITYSQSGYYYDTLGFASPPQYEYHQVCDRVEVTQTVDIESYIYFVDPEVSNDVPIQESCSTYWYSYSPSGIHSTSIPQTDQRLFSFTLPGTYSIYIYCRNTVYNYQVAAYQCSPDFDWDYDVITISFSHLDFDEAAALLCDSSSSAGIVYVHAVNGTSPYTYTLYDQLGATGNVIATNTSGYFENVPMTEGQQLSVQVTDSCLTSFSVNLTVAMLTSGSLIWEQDANPGIPYSLGDTVHLTALTLPPPATYQWTGPDGFTGASQSVDIALTDSNRIGWYYVEILNSFCGSLTDSFYLSIPPPPADYTFFFAESCDSYIWNGKTYSTSGTYYDTLQNTAGTDSILVLHLTVSITPEVSISASADSVCPGGDVILEAMVDNPGQLSPQTPPIALGDILCTDGDVVKPSAWPAPGKSAFGIVFFVDSTGAHGWAVDLHDVLPPNSYQNGYAWTPDEDLYADVPTLDNFPSSRLAVYDLDGYSNTQKLRADGDATLHPAAWAVDFDNGWYLPAIGQLTLLYSYIFILNNSLALAGGTPFEMNEYSYYWSSTERDDGNAWNLLYGGSPRADWKVYINRIRSIRDF